MSNISDNYPVAPPAGGTQRMRQVINEVDRTDDEENDFIYANDLRVSEYLTFKETVN